ncbi:phosphatase PAP2 family protein [Nocardioides sp.]|uniref:phosphatase PAP2 family protein n=1 Tax=Nocardioides sp. TaxID=35761 RepID=UPI00286AB3A6|nr:phosphatase PAP2 family protein [Nocardioides sp.]
MTVTTAASTTALKVLVHRDRPVWDDPVQTLTTFYPSGHASAIVAGAAAVTAVLHSFQVSRAARRGCPVGAFLLVLLVGADRVMLGVHNLSDVAGG